MKKVPIKTLRTKFALIKRTENAGFFSYVQTTLEYMHRAIDNGLIPVVDYRKGMDFYRAGDKPHNVWNLYFEQPYNPEDITRDFVEYIWTPKRGVPNAY